MTKKRTSSSPATSDSSSPPEGNDRAKEAKAGPRTEVLTASSRSIEDFAISIAIIGGLASWVARTFPSEEAENGPEWFLWLVGPFLVAAVLLTRDKSWGKLGFKPGGLCAWPWYLSAILATPLLCGLLFSLAEATGLGHRGSLSASATWMLLQPLVALLLVKNLFEEFYWRGFFTSRFEETPQAGLKGHIATGFIWAVWHLPYLLVFLPAREVLAMGGVPVLAFVGLAFLTLPLQSIFYGELRLLSGSIWPPFLMHSVSNLVTFYVLKSGFRMEEGFVALLIAPGTHGVIYSLLLGGLGLLMLKHRRGSLLGASKEAA